MGLGCRVIYTLLDDTPLLVYKLDSVFKAQLTRLSSNLHRAGNLVWECAWQIENNEELNMDGTGRNTNMYIRQDVIKKQNDKDSWNERDKNLIALLINLYT